MKRMLPLIAGVLALSTVAVVPAQALTPQEAQEKRQEIRQDMKENREEYREEKEMLQERKEDVVENVSQRHANRLETRFMFYENRLMALANKIERRLKIMESNGKDVSAANAKLTEGRGKIAQAATLGDEAVAAFRAIEAGEKTKEDVTTAKDQAQAARQAFVTALQTLQEATRLAAQSEK